MNRKTLACVTVMVLLVPTLVSAMLTNVYNDNVLKKTQELLVRGHVAFAFAFSENLSRYVEFELDDPGKIGG